MHQTYHQIQSGLEFIKYFKSFIKMHDEDKKRLHSPERGSSHIILKHVADLNPHIKGDQIKALINAAAHVALSTHLLRRNNKHRTDYMFVHNMAKESLSSFYSSVISDLEIKDLSASVTSTGGPYDLIVEKTRLLNIKAKVTIPCHWRRTVYDRGLHVVKANDGPRVVISATKKKVERLNDLNIQVFKGHAMGFKKAKGKYWLHDAWIMKHEGVDGDITALHEDFTKAEQLINRRIRKAVTEALNV